MNFYEYGLAKIAENTGPAVYPKDGLPQGKNLTASKIGRMAFKGFPYLDAALTAVGTVGAYNAARTPSDGIRDAVGYLVNPTPDYNDRILNYPSAADISNDCPEPPSVMGRKPSPSRLPAGRPASSASAKIPSPSGFKWAKP